MKASDDRSTRLNPHAAEPERLKATTPEGIQYNIPKLIRGKYVVFPLRLDLTRDWTLIQLIYSLPPRTRSHMIRDMLRVVVNAAHIYPPNTIPTHTHNTNLTHHCTGPMC